MGDTIARPSPLVAANQLGRLPYELVLQLGIPSLIRYCGLNRCMMQLVDLDHQYTAIIEHCPNIVRAIVNIQADAFDCAYTVQNPLYNPMFHP